MKRSRRRNISIYKAHGGREKFSRQKLIRSIERAGLSRTRSEYIADKVSREAYEGEKTKEIFKRTNKLLREASPVASVNYSLKRALFDLGPEGHHFEDFVGKYFEELGFKVRTCQIVKGKFVRHEIDVIAEKNGDEFFVECKFHNRAGIKNDIKLTLYVKARWDDVKLGEKGSSLKGYFIASNTSYTLDALTYSKGTGLQLLGVNAPETNSFLEQVRRMKLFPLTSLRSLNRQTKRTLLANGMVLAKEVPCNKHLLFQLGLEEKIIQSVIDEVSLLLGEKT